MIKEGIEIQEGVALGSAVRSNFSKAYLQVRELEQRVYTDEVVTQLPYLSKEHAQHQEWNRRQKSTQRFLDYLSVLPFDKLRKTTKNTSLLEIGCGNGWFTARCAAHVNQAIGVDVNLQELKQAARLFLKPNLQFLYWDVFSASPFTQKFDIILLNASVQYFPDFKKLKSRLLELSTPNGEIHIIDSPFYQPHEIEEAQKRTKAYYQKMGVEEMANNYHHHDINELVGFESLYVPETSPLKKLFKGKDMPFGWYRLINK